VAQESSSIPALAKGKKNLKTSSDSRAPHATEREQEILQLLRHRDFLAFRDLEREIGASPATLRRDLERLAAEGHIVRVHGGARRPVEPVSPAAGSTSGLQGVPFHENIARHATQKQAIGRVAAALCQPGEGVMIDGGSTTLQMCPHLDGLNLQVLTNSLHVVSALLPQAGTRVLVPGGAIFREQNIILSATGDELMPRFHAPRLFMGASSVGPQGIMQPDIVLVAAERRLIERAEQLILLVDSSKFDAPSGNVVCSMDVVDIVVTDSGIAPSHRRMLEHANVEIMIA
jgi:DeoR family transcriptional regulator, ulaG and ulaABCDEF operon transcriptional repressor